MNEKILTNPTPPELDDAFRSMPNFTSLTVSSEDMIELLKEMEKVGFVGMEILPATGGRDANRIRAYKGKHGPCYFNGGLAFYTGHAFAAIDDDLHLFIKDIPTIVCDKTKNILSLPPFKSLVKCITVMNGQTAHPDTVEDLEQGISFIFEKLKDLESNAEEGASLFYPGPFKALILRDGTILRRGRCNSIPGTEVSGLIKADRCFISKNEDLPSREYFQDMYKTSGSLFINDEFNIQKIGDENQSTDLSQLKNIGQQLKKRLLNTIENQRRYFVLVGSDMEEYGGCCPSKEVTDANMLARHGILSAYREPSSGESCPVTLYSFKDELAFSDGGFTAVSNEPLRRKVLSFLKGRSRFGWKNIVRWILLIFVGISLLFAVKQCRETRFDRASDQEVILLLNPQKTTQVQLILFHNQKRCFQCLEMERLTREVLDESYGEMMKNGQLKFTTIIMDNSQFSSLTGRYGLFSATLLLVRFDNSNIIHEQLLLQTGTLYKSESSFKTRLKDDLQQFIATTHE